MLNTRGQKTESNFWSLVQGPYVGYEGMREGEGMNIKANLKTVALQKMMSKDYSVAKGVFCIGWKLQSSNTVRYIAQPSL